MHLQVVCSKTGAGEALAKAMCKLGQQKAEDEEWK